MYDKDSERFKNTALFNVPATDEELGSIVPFAVVIAIVMIVIWSLV